MSKNDLSLDHRTNQSRKSNQLIKNSLIYSKPIETRNFASLALFGLWGKSPDKATTQAVYIRILNKAVNIRDVNRK